MITTTKVTDATVEPLTLAQAKTHLRETLVDADNDAYITALITVARTAAEGELQGTLITTTWLQSQDSFPGQRWCTAGFYAPTPRFTAASSAIELRNGPIIGVDFVKYRDQAGVLQTLDPAAYLLDVASGKVTPVAGTCWPLTDGSPGAVQVQYTAGYGAAADKVPGPIVQWIKLRIGALYEHRESVAVDIRLVRVDLPYVDALLAPYRTWPI